VVGYHQTRLLIIIPEQYLIEIDYPEFTRELFREVSLKPDVVLKLIFD
jgi:hypothetical protein